MINKAMLTEIRDDILANPDKFEMEHWAQRRLNRDDEMTEEDGAIKHCGTALCIGGLAVWKDNPKSELLKGELGIRDPELTLWDVDRIEGAMSVEEKARVILGLTHRQAELLFHQNKWPHYYRFNDEGFIPDVDGAVLFLNDIIDTGAEAFDYER